MAYAGTHTKRRHGKTDLSLKDRALVALLVLYGPFLHGLYQEKGLAWTVGAAGLLVLLLLVRLLKHTGDRYRKLDEPKMRPVRKPGATGHRAQRMPMFPLLAGLQVLFAEYSHREDVMIQETGTSHEPVWTIEDVDFLHGLGITPEVI